MTVRGFVMGKFYPPHAGHHRLLRQAARECDEVIVLVVASAAESIPLLSRVAWLADEHAADRAVRVLGTRCDAPLDVTSDVVWRAHVAAIRAALRSASVDRVDVVYAGDAYGPELAARLGAAHRHVERDGVSGSAIRHDLAESWEFLAPPTKAGLTVRAVVVGAESTGTSTVAEALAAHYRRRWPATRCVPEYGREYTLLKWQRDGDAALIDLRWTHEDFDRVAFEQTRMEEDAARTGSPVLICDTDAFATSIWERRYLGTDARSGQPWATAPQMPCHDVYFVTDHESVPWQDDGLREGDLDVRAAMTGWFVDALAAAGHSWVLLSGDLPQRVALAQRTIDQLLDLRSHPTDPFSGPGFGG